MKRGLNSFGDLNTQDYVVLFDSTRFADGLKYCTGFSSLSTDGALAYKIVGNMLFCSFFFEGTSNATTKTFTIPLGQSIQIPTNTNNQFMVRVMNNGGAATTGLARINAGNGTITVTNIISNDIDFPTIAAFRFLTGN